MATAIIGLGSNLQRPLVQLRNACRMLADTAKLNIQAYSSIYRSKPLMPSGAPANWADKWYLNAAIAVKTNLTPLALLQLLKHTETQLGREKAERWAPRSIDLDLLTYDDLLLETPVLTLPHPGLLERDFALIPLLELCPRYQHPRYPELKLAELFAPDGLAALPHLLSGPELLGILNLTPNSFSDGGKYIDLEAAVVQAQYLFEQGADIIDLGAESTRPGAALIDIDIEWQRLHPVLQALTAVWQDKEHRPLISIDTRHAEIIARALPFQLDIINDVSQEEFPAMLPFLQAEPHLRYVAMHHCGVPPLKGKTIHEDPIKTLQSFAKTWQERFQEAGLSSSQLILDPGFGFGKTPRQQIALIRQFVVLTQDGIPWLAGHSRKSFINAVLPYADMQAKEAATILIADYLAKSRVRYLRVHEPLPVAAAIRFGQILSLGQTTLL